MSEFILRPATKSDVPSLVALWYKCFFDPIPLVQKLFPDTEVVRGWYGKGFEKLISKEGNGVRFVVAVELDEEGVEGKVVGFTKVGRVYYFILLWYVVREPGRVDWVASLAPHSPGDFLLILIFE